MYIRDLYIGYWRLDRAETQYQGEGRSHEMAGLLLTECIQFSMFTLKQPTFVLYLDARSAFDVVQKELLLKNLFSVQPLDQSLIYLNNRLQNRTTFVDYNGCLMGPLHDDQGLEQGGVSSSELYKIFGKEQLDLAQKSKLGVRMVNLAVSSVGQADDTALVSNDIHYLFFLLQLSNVFSSKNVVQFSAEKTKLQAFRPKNKNFNEGLTVNPIRINDKVIPFTSHAEHVGILRSTESNIPTLIARFTAHKRALAAVLHSGLAIGHRANPIAGLKVHQLYGVPVLFSGLSALVLSQGEIDMIEKHYCETLRCLMRLLPKTPRSVVYFLSGSLPGCALLHQRQLMLYGMISRLETDILKDHAHNIYNSHVISKKSWFHLKRNLCATYNLPHPSEFLARPLKKETFKTLVKKKIISYWELKLREEASVLPSLNYFQSSFMSLTKPHPILSSAGSSPSKVSMAIVQATMISGRYRTQSLMRHWSTNVKGNCLLTSECDGLVEDLPHFIQHCPGLRSVRDGLIEYTMNMCSNLPPSTSSLILKLSRPDHPKFCHFILDCSTLPEVISLVQLNGNSLIDLLFDITRMWVFVLHRERLKRLNRWKTG